MRFVSCVDGVIKTRDFIPDGCATVAFAPVHDPVLTFAGDTRFPPFNNAAVHKVVKLIRKSSEGPRRGRDNGYSRSHEGKEEVECKVHHCKFSGWGWC